MTPHRIKQALALLDRHHQCQAMMASAAAHSQLTAMTAWGLKASHPARDGFAPMTGEEDGALIEALRTALDGLTGADRVRATTIIERANSLRRPLMAGWQAEAHAIIERRRADTEALATALGFNDRRGDRA